MILRLFRHTWGTSGVWEDLFPEFKAAGYHGIETGVPPIEDRPRFLNLLKAHGFDLILQISTSGRGVEEHLASFQRQVSAAATLQPLAVIAHSGCDAWEESDATRFFARAIEIEQAAGVRVGHETHRSRVLFNPWVCSRMTARLENLKICCDFSHWVCVCERLFDEALEEIVRQCAPRCLHLHARVGHEQGPQVSDPRAPEYAAQLAAHEKWWRMVWAAQEARGDRFTTLTPEFGPPPYAPTLPFTNTPLGDVPDICNWMARRQAGIFTSHNPA